jgi:hypothetical protein
VDLDLGSRKLSLTGDPSLSWAPLSLTLRGRRIQIALDSGELEVQLARARIHPDPRQQTKKNKENEKVPLKARPAGGGS